ncbi:MAG: hypothetical protein SWY16_14850 [Cyanobacteriota bacterium]|nr:hypothetical protein [Cyanobacteriota bacterium]
MTVEDRFELRWGLTIAPGLSGGTMGWKVGAAIVLRRPGRNPLHTHIAGFCLPAPNPQHCYPSVLPENIQKTDVPVGTEIWQVEGCR